MNASASTPSLSDSRSGKVKLPTTAAVEMGSSPGDVVVARPPLPKLPYSLRARKLSITVAWALILLDVFFLPLILFYVLKYGAKLNDARSKLHISPDIFSFQVQRILTYYTTPTPL